MTKHRKRGSSKAGRPRKEGARYPSGELKPRGPNEATLAHRKAICADPTMASCPLDAAFANGWLTFEEHLAGVRFARLYARSGIGGRSQVTASAQREAPVGQIDLRYLDFRDMTAAEIARVWDSAMRDVTEGPDDGAESRQGQALALYKAIHKALHPGEGQVLFQVCVQEQWPLWFAKRQAGVFDSIHEASYRLLVSGLRTIARNRPTPATPREPDRPVTVIPGPRPEPTEPSHGRDEKINYVTPEGDLVRTVIIKRRRPKAGRVIA